MKPSHKSSAKNWALASIISLISIIAAGNANAQIVRNSHVQPKVNKPVPTPPNTQPAAIELRPAAPPPVGTISAPTQTITPRNLAPTAPGSLTPATERTTITPVGASPMPVGAITPCAVDPAITKLLITKTSGNYQTFSIELKNIGASTWVSDPTQQQLEVFVYNASGELFHRVFRFPERVAPNGIIVNFTSDPVLNMFDPVEGGSVSVGLVISDSVWTDANQCNNDKNGENNSFTADLRETRVFMRDTTQTSFGFASRP